MVFGRKEINDDVEKSKVITRGTTEGSGVYSCTAADCATNPFTTTNKEEFFKHEKESPKHYRQGAAPCAICKNEVNMSVVLTKAGNEPIHKECIPKPEDEL